MIIQIPGHLTVSYNFFETDREGLEKKYGVTIDTGPGGLIEVTGSEEDVTRFLDDHGIPFDEVDAGPTEGEDGSCPECGAPPGETCSRGCPYGEEEEGPDPDRAWDSRADKDPVWKNPAYDDQFEGAGFDKFMDRIIKEERAPRGVQVLADSPLRGRARGYQERPLGKIRMNGGK